jgi:hypothetical protein
MAWNVEGRYFENCSCYAPCPCTASLDLAADLDDCTFVLVFHVDSGEVDGTDVSGFTVAAVGNTPKHMNEGNWRVGVLVDDAASDEQAEKLAGVFSGALGGPMAALGPLMGDPLGVERMAMEFSSEGGKHRLSLGDAGTIEIDDIVPWGVEDGTPAKYASVFHPLGPTLNLAKAGDSHVKAFGLEPELAGKSGFSQPFAWSA